MKTVYYGVHRELETSFRLVVMFSKLTFLLVSMQSALMLMVISRIDSFLFVVVLLLFPLGFSYHLICSKMFEDCLIKKNYLY